MLSLTRRERESIVINGNIVVKVLRIDHEINRVHLGAAAPADAPIHREEVLARIERGEPFVKR